MNRAPLRSLLNPLMALLVVLIVGNVGVFAAWTAPRWSSRLGAVGAAAGAEGIRGRVEPRLQLARDTYGRLARAESDLLAFRSRLITSAGGAALLGMLTDAGDTVGLDLDDATLQFGSIGELGVQQLAITLPVFGTYAAVRELLDELTALPVFLVVDGIGLQVRNDGMLAEGDDSIRVDLVISVFLEDAELAAAGGAIVAPVDRRAAAAARGVDALRDAAAGDDPEEIADALISHLAALPPLPVDPRSLVVNLDRLETLPVSTEPVRNLFAIVLPPPPPVEIVEEPDEFVEPEPLMPVRLLGVLRIEGRWHASFADETDLFVAEAGDSLPNGVEVVEVGADYAEVIFDGERTRLILEGSES